MLNRVMRVGKATNFMLPAAQTRMFRTKHVNPYLVDPTPLSDVERKEQTALPVWDRVFDHKKYMAHEGPLKVSDSVLIATNLACSIALYWYRVPRRRALPPHEADEIVLHDPRPA